MEYFEEEVEKDDFQEQPTKIVEETFKLPPTPKIEQEETIIPEITQDTVKQEIIRPEMIEIKAKEKVLPYVEPQDNKWWHFRFNDANQYQLTNVLQSIPGYLFTVTFGIPQNSADITLKQNEEIVGKIHFLLFDRPDKGIKSKYYIKLFFYDFKNQEIYDAVKSTLVNFFENFKPAKRQSIQKSFKSPKRSLTHKKRRNHNKKKSLRRK